MEHIHLIGIGGTGLSAIARVLLESGYTVSGSDRTLSPLAQSLREAGVRVDLGHRAENVFGADQVVRSSAVPDENPEVQAARPLGSPSSSAPISSASSCPAGRGLPSPAPMEKPPPPR